LQSLFSNFGTLASGAYVNFNISAKSLQRAALIVRVCVREREGLFSERLILDEKDEAKAMCSSQLEDILPPTEIEREYFARDARGNLGQHATNSLLKHRDGVCPARLFATHTHVGVFSLARYLLPYWSRFCLPMENFQPLRRGRRLPFVSCGMVCVRRKLKHTLAKSRERLVLVGCCYLFIFYYQPSQIACYEDFEFESQKIVCGHNCAFSNSL
jgi:hypothetical protein